MSASGEQDEFFIVEELDLSDETELRRIVRTVESLALPPNSPGLRVSVLTSEQWETALKRMLPPALRREKAHLYIHTLKDPREPLHLLVSLSAVEGINEKNKIMYQDVVYASLRCIPTDLANLLRSGVDNIVAKEVGRKIGVELYTKHHIRETEFVITLLQVLSDQFGYSILDWALEFRRRPKHCLMALQKSEFAAFYQQKLQQDSSHLANALTKSKLTFEDSDLAAVESVLVDYLSDDKEVADV